jgi:hypothetical protein
MNYITTGSSNSVLNGSPLELEIVISKDPLEPILPIGAFTVENLDTVVADDDLKNLSCKLFGKLKDTTEEESFPVLICELLYNPNNKGKRSFIIPDDYDEFDYLTVKITAKKCTINGVSKQIPVSFKDKTNTEKPRPLVRIDFTVMAEEVKPEITDFSSDSTVVAVKSSVMLSWNITGDEFILRKGMEVLKKGTTSGKGQYPADHISSGDNMYTLEVKKGNVSITKTVLIRVLNTSSFYNNSNPEGSFDEYRIGNFCVSQDSSRLFSLMLKTVDKKTTLDHIGYSYTNDGFSGKKAKWPSIELSNTEKEDLKLFAESPLLHMKSPGELHGRLFFIGGSSVKVMNSSKSVAIINLDTELGSRLSIIEDLPWSSRTAHSCVLFPHGDQDKIWLIGGVDEWGSGLNDIWVSGDGKTWENIQPNGSVTPKEKTLGKMPWEKRCLAGVAVELDDLGSKKALLVGGGFSEMGGSETSDIWKWDKNNWQQLTPLTINDINDSSYLSSGLLFLGKDTVESTGFYLLGGYKKGTTTTKYFSKIIQQNGNYTAEELNFSAAEGLTTVRNSKIIMGFFKGCMWYMVLTDKGDVGITYSNLFYWIPIPTSQTLILT